MGSIVVFPLRVPLRGGGRGVVSSGCSRPNGDSNGAKQ